jgi:hypothetical protein
LRDLNLDFDARSLQLPVIPQDLFPAHAAQIHLAQLHAVVSGEQCGKFIKLADQMLKMRGSAQGHLQIFPLFTAQAFLVDEP